MTEMIGGCDDDISYEVASLANSRSIELPGALTERIHRRDYQRAERWLRHGLFT